MAFIKPQAVLDNTDNKNQETWALNLASTDFELLCQDGTRKAVTEAATCNLAQVCEIKTILHDQGKCVTVENVNFFFLTPLSQKVKMLHFDANPTTI